MIIFTNAFIFYKLVNCLRQRTMNSPNTEKNLSLLKFLRGFWTSNRMQKTLLQLLTLAISNKKGFYFGKRRTCSSCRQNTTRLYRTGIYSPFIWEKNSKRNECFYFLELGSGSCGVGLEVSPFCPVYGYRSKST